MAVYRRFDDLDALREPRRSMSAPYTWIEIVSPRPSRSTSRSRVSRSTAR
jgi:hypothetical protein